MRYWFESMEDERDIGLQIRRWQEQGKIRMIEKGDPHEQIKENLIKIQSALETLRRFGINNKVMETYIYATSKVSKTNINAVLYAQKDFFSKMGLK